MVFRLSGELFDSPDHGSRQGVATPSAIQQQRKKTWLQASSFDKTLPKV
jgi:hypothetical protein